MSESKARATEACSGCGRTGCVRRPGRYDGCSCPTIARRLESLTLDGAHDEEDGDVCEFGSWFALLTDTSVRGARHAVLSVDSSGFVSYDTFRTARAAREAFDAMADEFAAWLDAAEEDE